MKIPSMDFRGQKVVNEDGTFTDVVQSFFDALNQTLTKEAGDEGLVMPTQTTDNMTVIQNNITKTPTGLEVRTCEYGTLIFDETTNKPMVAIDDGSGNPIFKEIVVM